MAGGEEKSLVARLNANAWAIFLALSGAALAFLPTEVTAGVIAGGLLVAVNLLFLRRAVWRALAAGTQTKPARVLPKFYLCFMLTVTIIFVLISQHLVNGLGLLLGLSTFLIDIFVIFLQETGKVLYRSIIKEAV